MKSQRQKPVKKTKIDGIRSTRRFTDTPNLLDFHSQKPSYFHDLLKRNQKSSEQNFSFGSDKSQKIQKGLTEIGKFLDSKVFSRKKAAVVTRKKKASSKNLLSFDKPDFLSDYSSHRGPMTKKSSKLLPMTKRQTAKDTTRSKGRLFEKTSLFSDREPIHIDSSLSQEKRNSKKAELKDSKKTRISSLYLQTQGFQSHKNLRGSPIQKVQKKQPAQEINFGKILEINNLRNVSSDSHHSIDHSHVLETIDHNLRLLRENILLAMEKDYVLKHLLTC